MMVAWVLSALGCSSNAPVAVVDSERPAMVDAPCATGCSGPAPAELEKLGDEQVRELLQAIHQGTVGAASLAADTLLFHGVEVLDYLDRTETEATAHVRWLKGELARDRVEVGLRLVSEDGAVLGWREDRVPLGEKQHLLLRETGSLGRADVNGKVKRVGVDHLWARF